MAEGQEGLPQSEGSQKTPEQERAKKYQEFGERSANIMGRVDENMFDNKTFEELVNELYSARPRKELSYKKAHYVRRGAFRKLPESDDYLTKSVIQGIAAAVSNRNAEFGLIYAPVRARDGSIDVLRFGNMPEVITAFERAVWSASHASGPDDYRNYLPCQTTIEMSSTCHSERNEVESRNLLNLDWVQSNLWLVHRLCLKDPSTALTLRSG